MSPSKWTGYVAPPISTAQQLRQHDSHDRASTQHHDIKGPASFLHLPYELREPIYHEILPANRILTVAQKPSWSEQAWLAIQQASPHVSNEMRDYTAKHCGRLLILKRKPKRPKPTEIITLYVMLDHSNNFSYALYGSKGGKYRSHGNRLAIPSAVIEFKRSSSTKPTPSVPLPSSSVSLSMSRLWKDDGLRRIYEKHYLAVDDRERCRLNRSKRARNLSPEDEFFAGI
ncbi:hypothetical protein LTR56_019195 [Elasticomyces elasticus]|nr:hypothetical protein LTR56_019195 [Elasticomyces elasticus]KAK3642685.1 hypothetical protein LTR22_015940 [Elasticomyces elasticus]KAK4905162.1 hypothetical protein LTR49_025510 [Elasticomyces elasticus]KAK5738110.1 hypothetical protein LTS12_025684 [Elasticomyces elasticus]